MKSRGRAILIGAVVAVFVAWFAAAPVLTFRDIDRAARLGDTRRLAQLVDFASVRASLKDQLQDRLQAQLSRSRKFAESPFGALGALIGPSIIDQVVEAAVTPAGVAAMVASGRAPLADVTAGKSALPPPPETTPPPAPGEAQPPKPKNSYAYVGLGAFRVTTKVPHESQPLSWVLERRGPIGWKLARVELPAG